MRETIFLAKCFSVRCVLTVRTMNPSYYSVYGIERKILRIFFLFFFFLRKEGVGILKSVILFWKQLSIFEIQDISAKIPFPLLRSKILG